MGQRGVFESNDGGARWRAVGVSAAFGEVTAIARRPAAPANGLRRNDAGVVVSHDGGRSWRMRTRRWAASHGRDRWYMQVTALLVDPRNSRTVYATHPLRRCLQEHRRRPQVERGQRRPRARVPVGLRARVRSAGPADDLRRRPDSRRGQERRRRRTLAGDKQGPRAWRGSPRSPSTRGARGPSTRPRGALGLFKSGDGGAHWRPLATGLKGVYRVAVDPNDPATLLVADATEPVGALAVGRTGSPGAPTPAAPGRAAGVRWRRGWASSRSAARRPTPGSVGGYGVFGSTDGGHSWRALGPPGVIYVQALAIEPGDAAVVYAGVDGTTRGLYKSTDAR